MMIRRQTDLALLAQAHPLGPAQGVATVVVACQQERLTWMIL
jgi:hypothetical protein